MGNFDNIVNELFGCEGLYPLFIARLQVDFEKETIDCIRL